MQVATAIDGDTGMVVKRLSVPVGLEELMESLTKQVLMKKPKDLFAFASEHFAHLVAIREKLNANEGPPNSTDTKQLKVKSVTSGTRFNKLPTPIIFTNSKGSQNVVTSKAFQPVEKKKTRFNQQSLIKDPSPRRDATTQKERAKWKRQPQKEDVVPVKKTPREIREAYTFRRDDSKQRSRDRARQDDKKEEKNKVSKSGSESGSPSKEVREDKSRRETGSRKQNGTTPKITPRSNSKSTESNSSGTISIHGKGISKSAEKLTKGTKGKTVAKVAPIAAGVVGVGVAGAAGGVVLSRRGSRNKRNKNNSSKDSDRSVLVSPSKTIDSTVSETENLSDRSDKSKVSESSQRSVKSELSEGSNGLKEVTEDKLETPDVESVSGSVAKGVIVGTLASDMSDTDVSETLQDESEVQEDKEDKLETIPEDTKELKSMELEGGSPDEAKDKSDQIKEGIVGPDEDQGSIDQIREGHGDEPKTINDFDDGETKISESPGTIPAGQEVSKEVESEEFEPKEGESKEVESKEVVSEEVESRKVESKEVEPKEVESREVESKEVEPKEVESEVDSKNVEPGPFSAHRKLVASDHIKDGIDGFEQGAIDQIVKGNGGQELTVTESKDVDPEEVEPLTVDGKPMVIPDEELCTVVDSAQQDTPKPESTEGNSEQFTEGKRDEIDVDQAKESENLKESETNAESLENGNENTAGTKDEETSNEAEHDEEHATDFGHEAEALTKLDEDGNEVSGDSTKEQDGHEDSLKDPIQQIISEVKSQEIEESFETQQEERTRKDPTEDLKEMEVNEDLNHPEEIVEDQLRVLKKMETQNADINPGNNEPKEDSSTSSDLHPSHSAPNLRDGSGDEESSSVFDRLATIAKTPSLTDTTEFTSELPEGQSDHPDQTKVDDDGPLSIEEVSKYLNQEKQKQDQVLDNIQDVSSERPTTSGVFGGDVEAPPEKKAEVLALHTGNAPVPLPEVNESGNDEEAAIKIQSAWRGYKTRKHLDKQIKNEKGGENLEYVEEEDEKKLASAATIIQALVRGLLVRRTNMKINGNGNSGHEEQNHPVESQDNGQLEDSSDPDPKTEVGQLETKAENDLQKEDPSKMESNQKWGTPESPEASNLDQKQEQGEGTTSEALLKLNQRAPIDLEGNEGSKLEGKDDLTSTDQEDVYTKLSDTIDQEIDEVLEKLEHISIPDDDPDAHNRRKRSIDFKLQEDYNSVDEEIEAAVAHHLAKQKENEVQLDLDDIQEESEDSEEVTTPHDKSSKTETSGTLEAVTEADCESDSALKEISDRSLSDITDKEDKMDENSIDMTRNFVDYEKVNYDESPKVSPRENLEDTSLSRRSEKNGDSSDKGKIAGALGAVGGFIAAKTSDLKSFLSPRSKSSKKTDTSLQQVTPEDEKEEEKATESVRIKLKDTPQNSDENSEITDLKSLEEETGTPSGIQEEDQIPGRPEDDLASSGSKDHENENSPESPRSVKGENELKDNEGEDKDEDADKAIEEDLKAKTKSFVDYEKENYVTSPREATDRKNENDHDEEQFSGSSKIDSKVLAGAIGVVGGLIASQTNNLKTLLASGSNSLEEARESLNKIDDDTKTAEESLVTKGSKIEEVKEEIDTVQNELKASSGTVLNDINDSRKDISDVLEDSTLQDSAKTLLRVDNTLEDLKDVLAKGQEDNQEKSDGIEKEVDTKIEELKDISEGILDSTPQVEEDIEGSEHKIEGVMTEAEDTIKGYLDDLENDIESQFKELEDTNDTIDTNDIGTKIEGVLCTVGDMGKRVKRGIDEAIDTINDEVDSLEDTSAKLEESGENVLEHPDNVVQESENGIKETPGSLAEDLSELKNDINEDVTGIQGDIIENVTDGIDETKIVKEEVLEKVSEASNVLTETISELAANVTDSLEKAEDDIREDLKELPDISDTKTSEVNDSIVKEEVADDLKGGEGGTLGNHEGVHYSQNSGEDVDDLDDQVQPRELEGTEAGEVQVENGSTKDGTESGETENAENIPQEVYKLHDQAVGDTKVKSGSDQTGDQAVETEKLVETVPIEEEETPTPTRITQEVPEPVTTESVEEDEVEPHLESDTGKECNLQGAEKVIVDGHESINAVEVGTEPPEEHQTQINGSLAEGEDWTSTDVENTNPESSESDKIEEMDSNIEASTDNSQDVPEPVTTEPVQKDKEEDKEPHQTSENDMGNDLQDASENISDDSYESKNTIEVAAEPPEEHQNEIDVTTENSEDMSSTDLEKKSVEHSKSDQTDEIESSTDNSQDVPEPVTTELVQEDKEVEPNQISENDGESNLQGTSENDDGQGEGKNTIEVAAEPPEGHQNEINDATAKGEEMSPSDSENKNTEYPKSDKIDDADSKVEPSTEDGPEPVKSKLVEDEGERAHHQKSSDNDIEDSDISGPAVTDPDTNKDKCDTLQKFKNDSETQQNEDEDDFTKTGISNAVGYDQKLDNGEVYQTMAEAKSPVDEADFTEVGLESSKSDEGDKNEGEESKRRKRDTHDQLEDDTTVETSEGSDGNPPVGDIITEDQDRNQDHSDPNNENREFTNIPKSSKEVEDIKEMKVHVKPRKDIDNSEENVSSPLEDTSNMCETRSDPAPKAGTGVLAVGTTAIGAVGGLIAPLANKIRSDISIEENPSEPSNEEEGNEESPDFDKISPGLEAQNIAMLDLETGTNSGKSNGTNRDDLGEGTKSEATKSEESSSEASNVGTFTQNVCGDAMTQGEDITTDRTEGNDEPTMQKIPTTMTTNIEDSREEPVKSESNIDDGSLPSKIGEVEELKESGTDDRESREAQILTGNDQGDRDIESNPGQATGNEEFENKVEEDGSQSEGSKPRDGGIKEEHLEEFHGKGPEPESTPIANQDESGQAIENDEVENKIEEDRPGNEEIKKDNLEEFLAKGPEDTPVTNQNESDSTDMGTSTPDHSSNFEEGPINPEASEVDDSDLIKEGSVNSSIVLIKDPSQSLTNPSDPQKEDLIQQSEPSKIFHQSHEGTSSKTLQSPTLEETIKDFKDAIQNEIEEAGDTSEPDQDSFEPLISSDHLLERLLTAKSLEDEEPPAEMSEEPIVEEPESDEEEEDNHHVDILIIDENYTSPSEIIEEEEDDEEIDKDVDDESEANEDHSESQQLIHEIKTKLDNIKAIIEEDEADKDKDADTDSEDVYNVDMVDEDIDPSKIGSGNRNVVIVEVTDTKEDLKDAKEDFKNPKDTNEDPKDTTDKTEDHDEEGREDEEIIEVKHDDIKKDTLEAHQIGRLISHDSSTSLDSLATVVLTEDLNKFREERKKEVEEGQNSEDYDGTKHGPVEDSLKKPKVISSAVSANQDEINEANRADEALAFDENGNQDDILIIDASRLNRRNEDDIKFLAGLVNAATKIQSAFRGYRVRNSQVTKGPEETLRGPGEKVSEESLEESEGKGPEETLRGAEGNGLGDTPKEFEEALKESGQTLNEYGETVNECGQTLKESEETKKESKDTLNESETTLKESGGTLNESGETLNDSEENLKESGDTLKEAEETQKKSEDTLKESDDTLKESEETLKESEETLKETEGQCPVVTSETPQRPQENKERKQDNGLEEHSVEAKEENEPEPEPKKRNPSLGHFLKTMSQNKPENDSPKSSVLPQNVITSPNMEYDTSKSTDIQNSPESPSSEPFYLHDPGMKKDTISEMIPKQNIRLLHSGEFHDSIPLNFKDFSDKKSEDLKDIQVQMAPEVRDAKATPPAGAERPVTASVVDVDVVASSSPPAASLSTSATSPLPPSPPPSGSAVDEQSASVTAAQLSHADDRHADQGETERDPSAESIIAREEEVAGEVREEAKEVRDESEEVGEAEEIREDTETVREGTEEFRGEKYESETAQTQNQEQETEGLDDSERRGHVPGSTISKRGEIVPKTAPESAKPVADMDPRRNNATVVERNAESQAATKIQASFRGYQVRKQMQKPKNVNDIISPKRNARRKTSGGRAPESKKLKDDIDIEDKSATKIQAGVRGFLVRRRNQKKRDNEEI